MKIVFSPIAMVAIGWLWALTGCVDPCANTVQNPMGGEFFSVVYQAADGSNALESRYRRSNVQVFVDSTGGLGNRPRFVRVQEDLSDGTFGPFFFTDDYIDPATRQMELALIANRDIKIDYYFQRDTFGIDTFSVRYRLAANECTNFWDYIHYLRNGDTLAQYDNQPQAEITIID